MEKENRVIKIIAERIKLAREQAGLSQGKVAVLLKMHRPSISEIEAGRRKISAEELKKFAEIFKVSISWLSAEGSKTSSVHQAKIELAARELSKIKKKDLDKVLGLLSTLREKQ